MGVGLVLRGLGVHLSQVQACGDTFAAYSKYLVQSSEFAV